MPGLRDEILLSGTDSCGERSDRLYDCVKYGSQLVMDIERDHIEDDAVIALLREHLADMHRTSPPESVYALDVEALRHPSILFWVAREDGRVLGCAALKELDSSHGEIKSMRTAASARKRGVAKRLLTHVIQQARERGYTRLSLETGSFAFFEPARKLYRNFGFEFCGPFADYPAGPNSIFMTREL